MNKAVVISIVAVVAVLIIGGGIYFAANSQNGSSQTTTSGSSSNSSGSTQSTGGSTVVNASTLASKDGKNGNACWVAVDGTVYEISGFAQWVDGVHTTSGGRARCGKDESSVINEAPHGKSVLRLLTVVGTYQP